MAIRAPDGANKQLLKKKERKKKKLFFCFGCIGIYIRHTSACRKMCNSYSNIFLRDFHDKGGH